MSSRRGFLSEISWFQVAASALAAVTAAWIASRLGVAGTLIGAALGSFVVTISTAFYGRTLDKGRTLIVQTASGTTVEKSLEDGDIAEAFREVEDAEHSPVLGAEVVEDEPRRLHWKTIIATTLLVLAVAVGAMGAYEIVTDSAFGDSDNSRIGSTFTGGGGGSPADAPDDGDDPDPAAPSSTPTADEPDEAPQPTASTPAPAPTPSASTPAPTPTPAATSPTPAPTPTATAPAE